MKQLLTVLIALMFLALQACEGPAGPAGVQGPAGKDGAKGADAGFVYFEGFKDSLRCASCHTPDNDTTYYLISRRVQWEVSKHNDGGNFDRNLEDCAGCHTTEGFMERASKSFPTAFAGQKTKKYAQSSPPGCFACHSPHKQGNFSVRNNFAPVVIKSNVVGNNDLTFDYGKGNLCVLCHQTREIANATVFNTSMKPDPTKTDTIVITTNRWYSHYGVQGEMLSGTGGFHFPGMTLTNSPHTNQPVIKQEGCTKCHMSAPTGGGTAKGGGHTMNIAYTTESGSAGYVLTGCNTSDCHNGAITSSNYKTYSANNYNLVLERLDTLQALLIQKGLLDATSLLVKLPKKVLNPATGKDQSYASIPMQKAGALWNYFFVEHDLSKGIHNSKYALALLDASIAEMKKP
ncbi:MAG: collagen-like protein [Bacteroidota bacterium]